MGGDGGSDGDGGGCGSGEGSAFAGGSVLSGLFDSITFSGIDEGGGSGVGLSFFKLERRLISDLLEAVWRTSSDGCFVAVVGFSSGFT